MEKQNVSNDFKVLLTIYEQTILNNNNVDYTALKGIVHLPPKQISISLDKLYDRNMIDMKSALVTPKTQSQCYFVSQNFLPFTKGLYNHLANTKSIQKTDEKQKITITNATTLTKEERTA